MHRGVQGRTLEAVAILPDLGAPAVGYVAITRVRALERLFWLDRTDGQIFHPRVEKKRVGNLHPRQTACPLLAQACSQPSKRLCLARQAVLFQLAMQISEQANLVASKRRTGPGGRPPEIPLALACQALIHGIQQDTEDTRLQGWGRAVNLASACA